MMAAAVLVFISGFAKGLADRIQFHYETMLSTVYSDYLFWNPSLSWRNKYKYGNPDLGPKFWGSTTIFVWTTDGWHMLQFVLINSFLLACLCYSSWLHPCLDFIILRAVFALGFHLIYK